MIEDDHRMRRRILARPARPLAVCLALACLWPGVSLPAQAAGGGAGTEAADAGGPGAPEAAVPAMPDKAPDEPTRIWGGAWYSLGASDKPRFASISDWTATQQAGVSVNLRSNSGLEILSDLSVGLNTLAENTPDNIIQQLSIRFAPTDWLSLVAGKQRLKWGTGQVFAAIDKGEQRTNPLDQRSVLSGLSGFKAELLPVDWLGFSVLVMPESDLRWTGGAVRADLTLADLGLDVGLGVIKYQYNPLGGGPVAASGPAVDRLDRLAFILDAAWGSGDVTVYGEAELRAGSEKGYWLPGMAAAETHASGSRDQAVFRGLLGLMWQLNLGLSRPVSLIAEYLYNGDGLDQGQAQAFRGRWLAWKGGASSASSGALPVAFSGLGAFRQHYLSLAFKSVALSRYLLLDVSGICGLDSGLLLGRAALSYEFMHGTALSLSWDAWTSLADESVQPNELLFLGNRNRITLTVSTGF